MAAVSVFWGLRSVSSGNLVQTVLFIGAVCDGKPDEDDSQHRDGTHDCARVPEPAENRGNQTAEKEKEDHGAVHFPAERGLIVLIPDCSPGCSRSE